MATEIKDKAPTRSKSKGREGEVGQPDPATSLEERNRARHKRKIDAANEAQRARYRELKEKFASGKLPRLGSRGLKDEKPRLESELEERIESKALNRLLREFTRSARTELAAASIDDRKRFLTAVTETLGLEIFGATLLPLPSKAPMLWKNKDKSSSDNPAEFITRHYGRWLGHGFTQASLKALDPGLYMAFHNWKRNERAMPAGFYLPTKDEWYDHLYRNPGLLKRLKPREQGLVLTAIGNRLLKL